MGNKSELEDTFFWYWRNLAGGYPMPERNAFFHIKRRWRVDFLWRVELLVVEIEGQVWGPLVKCHKCGIQVLKFTKAGASYKIREAGGRHVRGDGFEADVEKYNTLTQAGYRLLRATKRMLENDPAGLIESIITLLEGEQATIPHNLPLPIAVLIP